MSNNKFDSLLINGSSDFSSKDILDSYRISQEQLKQLPSHLKKDSELVSLKLFQEISHQKKNNSFFRKSDKVNCALVTYWLSNVKHLANVFSSINNIPKFEGISKQELIDIASLNSEPENIIILAETLANKGIILVLEPSIDGLKTDGVVFKLDSGHPVIGISLRYKRLDMFWFTLMHELSHICLHYDRLDDYIVDDFESGKKDTIELEADKLASNSLIPRSLWRTCPAKKNFTQLEVEKFARNNNIHPIIVAGRIQKEQDAHGKLARYVNSIDVRELIKDE